MVFIRFDRLQYIEHCLEPANCSPSLELLASFYNPAGQNIMGQL